MEEPITFAVDAGDLGPLDIDFEQSADGTTWSKVAFVRVPIDGPTTKFVRFRVLFPKAK